ncbi:arsenite methyltransferase [Conger conger]|uniref:arsenite methyltransferase n=1 Tax=Conger conger TaxID=82655 RepID=UPI002A5A5654|nr:arsenite methyltransferase [Conger conger]
MATPVHENVQKYYGSRLGTSEDLQTSASCALPSRPMSKSALAALKLVHPEVSKKYFGCGMVVPEKLTGCRILDLGSGSGRDCYILSKLVGKTGHVIGLDMTEELVLASQKYVTYHQEAFGFEEPNTVFLQGYMERLEEAGIQSNSVDVLVSNCVICLCPDKKAVLKEAYRVLKDGGEFYFSDMYANKVVPEHLKEDPVLWGEGMGGSLFWLDLIGLVQDIGFSAPRLVTSSNILVHNTELSRKTGDIKYTSGTYRFFKLPKDAEMVPAIVTYKGTVPDYTDQLDFDSSHSFKRGVPFPVDAETAAILRSSRYSSDFCIQASENQETLRKPTPQHCHLDPFLLAESLGSCVRHCSKTQSQAGCGTAPPGGCQGAASTGHCGK